MKTLERAFRRLGVEGARRHVMCGEVVKQGAGDGRFADASLVSADQDQCRFRHNHTLTDAKLRVSILKLIFTQAATNLKD